MIEEPDDERAQHNQQSSGLGNRIWRYGPPIAWALLIFVGSGNFLSSSNTAPFLIRPLRYLFPGISDVALVELNFAIRKLGHLTEYFILALFTARALRTSSRAWLRTRWFWISLLLIVAYSLLDEFRQSFVKTRTPSIYDSMIDSTGGLIGLLLIWWRARRKARV